MKFASTFLVSLFLSSFIATASAQVPPERIMVCKKFLWVINTGCTHINKPKPKPVSKKQLFKKIRIGQPLGTSRLTPAERQILGEK